MVLRKSRCLGKGAPLNGAPAKIIFCVESEKNMEYNPINALKMKSFSGYTPKKPYRWAVTNVCCQFLCIPVIPEKSFVTRGYKHVGMRLAYFACPYPYAFVKRECPRDAKFICGIIGIQKKCQQHLTQSNLKIYWKIRCESTILDIYESRLAK